MKRPLFFLFFFYSCFLEERFYKDSSSLRNVFDLSVLRRLSSLLSSSSSSPSMLSSSSSPSSPSASPSSSVFAAFFYTVVVLLRRFPSTPSPSPSSSFFVFFATFFVASCVYFPLRLLCLFSSSPPVSIFLVASYIFFSSSPLRLLRRRLHPLLHQQTRRRSARGGRPLQKRTLMAEVVVSRSESPAKADVANSPLSAGAKCHPLRIRLSD